MTYSIIDDQDEITEKASCTEQWDRKVRHEIHEHILRRESLDFDSGRMTIGHSDAVTSVDFLPLSFLKRMPEERGERGGKCAFVCAGVYESEDLEALVGSRIQNDDWEIGSRCVSRPCYGKWIISYRHQ